MIFNIFRSIMIKTCSQSKADWHPIRNNKKGSISSNFLFYVVAVVLASLIVMLIWNTIIPSIFGLPTINYGQAVGLFMLSDFLFNHEPLNNINKKEG